MKLARNKTRKQSWLREQFRLAAREVSTWPKVKQRYMRNAARMKRQKEEMK